MSAGKDGIGSMVTDDASESDMKPGINVQISLSLAPVVIPLGQGQHCPALCLSETPFTLNQGVLVLTSHHGKAGVAFQWEKTKEHAVISEPD